MEDEEANPLLIYLEDPSPDGFLRLRQAAITSPDYAPYSNDLDTALDLIDGKKWVEAREYLYKRMGNWLLSPRVHGMLAYTFKQTEETDQAELEIGLSTLLLEGILSTGDGTQAQPFLVCRTEDEYDVLDYLGKESRDQRLLKQ